MAPSQPLISCLAVGGWITGIGGDIQVARSQLVRSGDQRDFGMRGKARFSSIIERDPFLYRKKKCSICIKSFSIT